jgi:hypothetical protein
VRRLGSIFFHEVCPKGSEERSRFEASTDLVIDPAGAAPAAVAAYIKDDLKAQILVDMCGR